MIPILVDAGNRVIVPDLVGFGRSDKPAQRNDYTFQRHVDWMQAWFDQVDLKRVTCVGQDWGGLIGLRQVANRPGSLRPGGRGQYRSSHRRRCDLRSLFKLAEVFC